MEQKTFPQTDRLSKSDFCAALEGSAVNHVENVHILQVTDSTNTRLKEMAKNGAPHGTVVIAEEQTAGKGRLGRSFYSPANTGLYLSLLRKTTQPLKDGKIFNPALYTIAAAVAVIRALRSVCGIETLVKWVNDIYHDGKKICGILSEGVTGSSSGFPEFIIIGIGVNVRTEDFPDDIKNRAGSVVKSAKTNNPDGRTTEQSFTRNRLAAKIVSEIFELLECEATQVIEEYRKYSFILGKEILVFEGQKTYSARALDIDENGCLLTKLPDGNRKILNSGEVSVRETASPAPPLFN